MKTPAQLKAQYLRAKDVYYNDAPLNKGEVALTDAEFDKLEEQVKKHFPALTKKTGLLGKKKPVKLLVPMPSLDKCKAHMAHAAKYVARINKFDLGAKVIMEKLDGSSVFAHYARGKLVSLATRGDGITGQDITFLAPYCKTLPQTIKTKDTLFIRMEAVLSKAHYRKYYKDVADSARAGVSGALNRTDASRMLNHIHFVALRLLTEHKTLVQGLKTLDELGFMVVRGTMLRDCTDENLTAILEQYREQSLYEIDGIVVHANQAPLPVDDKRPKFAFSYKLDTEADDAPLTTIRSIVWKKSAFNVLVPKAVVDPVDFDGVTVKHAALHNYAWAKERGCGIGAQVRIIRSGDIIPKIVKIEQAMPMSKPSVTKFGEYTFDGTNLVCNDTTTNNKALLERFFKHTGLDGFGPSIAEALSNGDYTTSDVCRMTRHRDWFKKVTESDKMAVKFSLEVNAMRERITVDVAMAASGVFDKGVGTTRIRSLIKAYPLAFDYLTMPYSLGNRNSLVKKAEVTAGCGPAFAKLLAKGYKEWCEWYKSSKLDIQPPVAPKPVTVKSGKYAGKKFSWTGYRDPSQEYKVIAGGGEVISLGSKTDVLFYNPNGKFMAKVDKAAASGVTISLFDNY